MIIDSHCHAWARWPYDPPVPDPDSRGRAERLLWEMDQHGVAQAILISAGIRDNPDNMDYTRAAADEHADRLIAFPDIDCRWSATHHTPGAAERLIAIAKTQRCVGFTHYLDESADPSWLLSDDGLAFFAAADTRQLIVSLACGPTQMETVRKLAERFPRTPFLIHHLGRVRAAGGVDREALKAVLGAASAPNIFIKLSGFGYALDDGWNFPCDGARDIAKSIYDRYGAARLVWGSDYPVSQRYMTYRQSLDIVRTHCSFLREDEMALVLGGAMKRLLDVSRRARTISESKGSPECRVVRDTV